ncbi:MAG: ComEC/Rec2 family competence protein [Planctomycetes bacterium]|nr:ComEC/Rec2 family competence protein [Planctomycetota bacterium]
MDDIQRKLALIDRQLAGRNLHKQIISTCPLVFVAVGLIAGILIQHTLDLSIWFCLISIGVCIAATTLLYVVYRMSYVGKEEQLTYILAYTALACFVCLGSIRLLSFHQPKPNDIRNFVTDEPKLATIRGLIITEPYINKNRNWKFARFKLTDPSSSFYLKVREVKAIPGWTKAAGTVRVQVDGPVLDLKAGDYIQAYCRLDRFSPSTNPGQFNTAKYLARKNVFIAASVKSRDGIKLLESPRGGIFTKVKRKMRQTAAQALLGNLSLEDRSRGLLEALLLGYRGNIDSNTYRAFRKTGLLHFISLSGMHLGILVWIIWRLCQAAGLMKPARATICIIAIGIFLMTVPPRAPIQRAAIICWVFCVSVFFRRHSNRLNTLSLAAIILLLIRPTALFEAGWQLSFSTVLGILFFTRWIGNFLHEKTGNWFWNISSGNVKFLKRRTKRLGKGVITIFSIGLAAWLGGAGIALYHFHTITPFTAVWTVVAFPLVAGILTVGFLKIILSFLLPTVALGLGIIVDFLSISMIWIVEYIASWDISEILIGKVPGVVIICYYGFVLFAIFVYFWRPLMKRPLLKKAIYTVIVLAMIAFLGVTKWQRTHRDNLVITCLDVGHGQAIFAQLPGKANVLFDAGSLHKSDIGRRIVVPFLDYAGVNKIDAVIVSHNDIDHINGIPEIAEHREVGAVYASDVFFDEAEQWGTAKFLNNCLVQIGIKIQPVGKDLNLSGGANIKILWPSEEVCKNEDLGDNDKSLVSLIEFAGTKVLLCSDIEKFAQRELLRLYPDLKVDIVVVPHHGSVNTLEDDFLEKLDADILIYSCGRTQYERQQQMIKGKGNAKSFYTPEHGAVAVSISRDGMIKTTAFAP